MADVTYSRGVSITDARPAQLSVPSFDAFCTAILADRCAGKDGAPYICGPMRDSQRSNAHAMPRRWVALDMDKGGPEAFARLHVAMASYSALIYTTASHTAESPRARVIVELSAFADPASVKATTAKLRAAIGVAFDPSCDSPTQALYLPTRNAQHWRFHGAPVVPSPGVALPVLPVTVPAAHPLACLAARIDLDRMCHKLAQLASGERNAKLAQLAFTLGGYVGAGRLDRDAVTQAIEPIIAAWRDAEHDRCTLERQLDAGIREPLVLHVPTAVIPFPARTASGGRIGNLADLMRQTFNPPMWAIHNILPGGATIVAGPPKSGKSFLVLQWGIAIATGTAIWNGRGPEVQGGVLYIALEDKGQRMQRRVRKYIDDQHISATHLGNFDYVFEWSRGAAGVAEIRAYLGEHPECRMVIIDTLGAFRETDPGRKSAYAHDYETGALFKEICREFDIAVVLVMHTRKQAAADHMDTVSGTQGMTGSVDNVLTLQKPKRAADENYAVLNVDGRDIESPSELALSRNAQTGFWACMGSVADVSRTSESSAVLAALATIGMGSPRDILAAMGGEMKLPTLTRRLARMAQRGEISRTRHGQYVLSTDADDLPDPPPIISPIAVKIPGAG